MLERVATQDKRLADYQSIVGAPIIDELRRMAAPLAGARVVHVVARVAAAPAAKQAAVLLCGM